MTATSRPGIKAAVGEAQHDAQRAQVVMAEHGSRGVGFFLEELADCGGAVFSRRQAIDDRTDRQSEPREDRAKGFRSVPRGRHAARASDEGDALMPKPDQVFGRQRHAESEVGADVVRALPADAPQHLDDRNALRA